MISSAGGRAIMFSFLLSTAIGFNALVTGSYALRILRDHRFMQHSTSIGKGCCVLSFIGATLGVSAVWFQMSEKIRAGAGEPKPFWMLPGFSVIAIAFLGMIVMVLVSIHEKSSSVIGVVGLIFIGFISYTYRVAGRRVTTVLFSARSGGDPGSLSYAAQQTQIIAIKVRETASFMSRAFAALGVVFLWFALSAPSQSPLYPGQNNLPRLCSGQAALIAVC
jgi:hypothetical protein